MDTLEAMGTARAMRWFRPDPVPDEHIDTLLWAATQASSAHNSQPWQLVVVRSPATMYHLLAEPPIRRSFGPLQRRRLADVVHRERW